MVLFDLRNVFNGCLLQYDMDEHLESSWHLVCYQVSGESGIARCVIDIGHSPHGVWTCKLIHWSSLHSLFFACLIFAFDLDHKIILTAKFSRSTVMLSLIPLGQVLKAVLSTIWLFSLVVYTSAWPNAAIYAILAASTCMSFASSAFSCTRYFYALILDMEAAKRGRETDATKWWPTSRESEWEWP